MDLVVGNSSSLCGSSGCLFCPMDLEGPFMTDPKTADMDREYEEPEDALPFCNLCQGSGMMNCYCGGDQCYCDWHGEKPCTCPRGEDAI